MTPTTRLMFRWTMGLGLMALAAQDLAAQEARNCGPRQAVIDRLAGTYGETRRSLGLGSEGAVVEVFASSETGSWTITVTLPNGTTCLVAAGQSFEAVTDALPAKGKDA